MYIKLLNACIVVLLLVLAVEAAGISQSLRRIERGQRQLVNRCTLDVLERPSTGIPMTLQPIAGMVQLDFRTNPAACKAFRY